jgi:hypothetical protein
MRWEWSENMKLLRERLLDLLSLYELSLEELYTHVNLMMESTDETSESIRIYREQFHLPHVVRQLRDLISDGLVYSRESHYGGDLGEVGCWFGLTEAGEARAAQISREYSAEQLYVVWASGVVRAPGAQAAD